MRQPAFVAPGGRKVRRDFGAESQAFLGGQRLDRGDDAVHDVAQRGIAQRQRELPRLDFRQIEHVVDQPQQMPAVDLNALEHRVRLRRHLAIDAVENEFGVAQDRVQRRAQLVTHVGEELRFVPAGDLELAAFFLDLAEQPRVLDRHHRLHGESVEQLDDAFRKFAGLLAPHHQRADDAVRAKQRHDQHGPISLAQDDVVHRRLRLVAHVGNLDRPALRGRRAHPGVVDRDVLAGDRLDHFFGHAVGRA